ncbi:glutamine amidotransferase-related protein [Flaviflexus equikiangi]|uniref:glutamine amidotransferase-related protein n=1 Tax=Flaviflexus equikiangi TaxID=2758573 RepID=UPI0015F6C8EA|nr:gamma-glutamyl-gamma-aminobutyrate hydrolase family protein [Flaviflexus equikiangi]
MRPFLFLICRPPGLVADSELGEVHERGKLEEGELVSRRLELPGPLPDLDEYSGVLISGSPYNLMTAPEAKPATQVAVEEKLAEVCDEVLERDIPTLGLCFGLQMLALRSGGALTRDHAEPLSAPTLRVTAEGREDPLLAGVGDTFQTYVGHAEAIGRVPESMTVLVTSDEVPVQMGRWGRNVYGTQFHPEITKQGSAVRVGFYGGTYFDPQERDRVMKECQDAYTEHTILSTFIETYRS